MVSYEEMGRPTAFLGRSYRLLQVEVGMWEHSAHILYAQICTTLGANDLNLFSLEMFLTSTMSCFTRANEIIGCQGGTKLRIEDMSQQNFKFGLVWLNLTYI